MGASARPGAGGEPANTASAIREAQARLDELLLRFTDKYPDVVAARQTLEDLESARRRKSPPCAAATRPRSPPRGWRRIRSIRACALQLSQADVEVAAARAGR